METSFVISFVLFLYSLESCNRNLCLCPSQFKLNAICRENIFVCQQFAAIHVDGSRW